MKNLFAVLVFTATLLLPTTNAHANDEQLGLKLCHAVANDNKPRFRSAIAESSVRVRQIFSTFRCNDKDILIFAQERGADKVGSYVIRRLRKEQVADLISQLDPSSPIGAAALKRLSK